MKTSVKYCSYSETIRLFPFNYWLASTSSNKLRFNSWDAQSKLWFKKHPGLYLKVIIVYISVKLGYKKYVKPLNNTSCIH